MKRNYIKFFTRGVACSAIAMAVFLIVGNPNSAHTLSAQQMNSVVAGSLCSFADGAALILGIAGLVNPALGVAGLVIGAGSLLLC